MRKLMLAALIALAMPAAAEAGGLWFGNKVPPFKGNDTGGIIAWSPDAHRHRHAIASDHCGSYGKFYRITTVHRWYGDYISFACYWPRGYEPGAVVLRRRY